MDQDKLKKQLDDQLDEDVAKVESVLDAFESEEASFPSFRKVEYPECLGLSIDELRKRSPEELACYAYEIGQYCLYLQRLMNRNRALEKWAKAKLDELTARYLLDIGQGFGFNERMLMARHNPPACQRLNTFLRKKTMELERLSYIPDQIRIIADSIRDLRFIALKREKEYSH